MAKIFRIVDNILCEYGKLNIAKSDLFEYLVNYKHSEKSHLCAKNTGFMGFEYDEIFEKELLDKCSDM